MYAITAYQKFHACIIKGTKLPKYFTERTSLAKAKSYPVQTWYTDRPPNWHHVTWLLDQKVKGKGHNVT